MGSEKVHNYEEKQGIIGDVKIQYVISYYAVISPPPNPRCFYNCFPGE